MVQTMGKGQVARGKERVMLIIQLMKLYIAGEEMPKRIRYPMMCEGHQIFRWDADAEEYVCETDKDCYLSEQVPWHHLIDGVELLDESQPDCPWK